MGSVGVHEEGRKSRIRPAALATIHLSHGLVFRRSYFVRVVFGIARVCPGIGWTLIRVSLVDSDLSHFVLPTGPSTPMALRACRTTSLFAG